MGLERLELSRLSALVPKTSVAAITPQTHITILTKKATPKSRLERFVNYVCLQLQGSSTKCFPKREWRTIFEHILLPDTKLTNEESLTMFDFFEKFIFVNP